MVRVVWLALRSVWWRRGQSLVVLVVALLGVTAAATGPRYQRAVAESALQQGLRSAPARTTGVDVEVESDGATRGYAVEDQVVSAPTGAGLDRFFGPARVVLRMTDPLLLPAVHSTAVFAATLLWCRASDLVA